MYSVDAVVTSSCIAPDLQLTLALFLVQSGTVLWHRF